MPEESTTTVESPQQRCSRPWLTPKRAIIGIIALVLSSGLVLTILDALGVNIAQSTRDAVQMSLLAVIGVVAGITGARLRKRGNWQTALTAYRVAAWCLFLAFWTALQFHWDAKREDFTRRLNEKMQQFEEHKNEK